MISYVYRPSIEDSSLWLRVQSTLEGVAGISFAGDIEMGDYFVLVYASHSVLVFEPGPQRQWEFELATTGQLFLYNY